MIRAIVVASLFSGVLLLLGPGAARADQFDNVFGIMNLESGGDSPGCGDCHIGAGYEEPCPLSGTTHWGETQDGVLDCLIRRGYLDGGRNGRLAEVLGLIEGIPPRMPRFADLGDGRYWNECELGILGAWLDSLSDPGEVASQ